MSDNFSQDAIQIAKVVDGLDANQIRQLKYSLIEQGYGLESFIHDPDRDVRITCVAYCGTKQLEQLINDKDRCVLLAIIQRNFGLDKLAQIDDPLIQKAIQDILDVYWYSNIREWIKDNPDRCVLPENKGALNCSPVAIAQELEQYSEKYNISKSQIADTVGSCRNLNSKSLGSGFAR